MMRTLSYQNRRQKYKSLKLKLKKYCVIVNTMNGENGVNVLERVEMRDRSRGQEWSNGMPKMEEGNVFPVAKHRQAPAIFCVVVSVNIQTKLNCLPLFTLIVLI